LEQLLKLALRIDVYWCFRQLLEITASLRQNEFLRWFETAVEVDGADERFERVRQCGRSSPATTAFFAASHQNVASQVQCGSMRSQCFARNQPGAEFRQLTFGFDPKMPKQILGDNKLENCVAQKFQTLIIKMITLRLVAEAGVRERLRQQK